MRQAIVKDAQGNEIAAINIPDGATNEQVQQKIQAAKALYMQRNQPQASRADVQAQTQQPQADELVADPSLWESVKSGVREAVTGEERTQALPEDVRGLPEFSDILNRPPESLDDVKAIAKMLVTLNPEAQKDIIKSTLPGSKFIQHGDTWEIVSPSGTRSVVNKPGLSGQDMVSFMTEALSMYPATKLASIPAGLITRFGLGAVGGAATDFGLQKGAEQLGSEQDYNKSQTAIAGLSLGLGETIAPIARGIGRQAQKVTDRAAINKMVREGSTREETSGYLLKGQARNQPYVQQPDASEIFSELTPVLDDITQQPSLPSPVQADDASFAKVPESEGLTAPIDDGLNVPIPPEGIIETGKQLLPIDGRVVKAKSKKDLDFQEVPVIVPNLIRTASPQTRRAMDKVLDAHTDEVSGGKSKAYGVIGNEFQPFLNKIKKETTKAIDVQTKAIDDLSKISGVDISTIKQNAANDFSKILDSFGIKITNGKLDYTDVKRESAYIAQGASKAKLQKIYNQLINATTAKDLHFAKKDAQNIIYQESALGKPLAKDVKDVINAYQKNINLSLRELSPEYAKANDVLSKNQKVTTELKNAFKLDDDALDNLDDVGDHLPDMKTSIEAERTLNDLGLQLRKLDTNYKKSPEIQAAIDNMVSLAKEYGYKGGSDLASLARFLNGVKASHIGDKLGTHRGIQDSAAKKAASAINVKQGAADVFNAINKIGQENIGIGKKGTHKAIKKYIKEVDKSQKTPKGKTPKDNEDIHFKYRESQGGYLPDLEN